MSSTRDAIHRTQLLASRYAWGVIFLMINLLLSAGLYAESGASTPQTPDLEGKVIEIFENNCTTAGCHGGANPMQGLKLTRDSFYSRTVNQPSVEKPELMRVDPGNPDKSYLVQKITGAEGIIGLPMPFGRDALTQEEITTVIEWIKNLKEVDTSRMVDQSPDPLLPFPGWKVLNTPSARMVDKGDWLFLIAHRFFPPLTDGYDAFFGIDGPAVIFLNLGYAVNDNLFINLGRTNVLDDVELNVKYGLKNQYPGDALPFAAALQANVNWNTQKPASDAETRFRSDAFAYSFQGILSSQIGDRFAANLAPGILFNPNIDKESEDPLMTVALGGRVHVWNTIALIGEWVPIVSGYTETNIFGGVNRFDSWGAGMEIFLRGHVFQIVVSNAVGLTSDQYMTGGDLDIQDGDLRLGFNIFRQLQF